MLGIAIAYYAYLRNRGWTAALQRRLPGLHDFLERKWYFDEAIDVLVVRPALAVGRWSNSIFERYVVQGLVVAVTDLVRGANAGGAGRPVRLPALLRPAAGHRLRRARPLLPAAGS